MKSRAGFDSTEPAEFPACRLAVGMDFGELSRVMADSASIFIENLGEAMKIFGALGAFFCFLAVLAGAVGSHALKEHLVGLGSQSNFDLATRYMFYHGLAMILLGIAKERHSSIPFQVAGWLFVSGTILFQGNLYLISLTNVRLFSFLTPIGGMLLLVGWLSFAFFALKIRSKMS
jgi:uncharacterized membrane protein YgdD (TMEM256/DUF423 family)